MAYLQSNEGSYEEIAGGIDGVLLDFSENLGPFSEECNGFQLVATDDLTPNTTIIATRISPIAVSVLFGYFESRNFSSNQTLLRKNSLGHEELDTTIHNFGLKKTQAARQLRSWKGSKLMIDEHVLTILSVEISSSISDRLSILLEEIIEISLDSMLPSKSKKMNNDSSDLPRFSLAQSSDVMEKY